jgi:glutamate synthase domain-containing protein 2/nitrite reductase/ring-hydroxylating ferredoxin subunit
VQPVALARWDEIEDRTPTGAPLGGVDLVIVRWDDNHSVLYGRCLHRGALLADGRIEGADLICGLHGWDYRMATGVSAYNNAERLQRFVSWIEDGNLMVDAEEIAAWEKDHPQPWDRSAYQGAFQDPHATPEEPHVGFIRRLADGGIEAVGHHGPVVSMGVPRTELPSWDDIQFVTAQLARRPLLDDHPVATTAVIGPNAAKPLNLDIPIFVSDMSFGALSFEAKVALARGAELAGTGICSGEGGSLTEEREANSRYFYELASGRFGFSMDIVAEAAAFHFKFGQGAKTGTGGHLPGSKVTGRIAETRGLEPGTDAISPATFTDLVGVDDFRAVADDVREATGGAPIGAKMSAQHVEEDIDAALDIGVDYIILDGRGGGTGAAPALFRDHISVPTIPALARARRHLDLRDRPDVSLVITGGLRTHTDFAKALALGADAVAISNSAMQAIGCIGMRACNTNNCPVGIATQQPRLRARLPVDDAAERLARYLNSTVQLMTVIARALGRDSLADLAVSDLTTFDRDMAHLSGVRYGGVHFD